MARSVRPPQPLGHSLRQLVRWAIAGSLGAAAGCGGGSDDGPPTYSGTDWTALGCDDRANVLRNASFARDRDHFSLWRDAYVAARPDGEGYTRFDELGSAGEACSSASDRAACLSAFEAATKVREPCRVRMDCGVFAVVTQGDTVTQLDQRAELLSWLAPIDSLSDALAVSAWDNKPLECSTSTTAGGRETGTRYQRNNDHFSFSTLWDNCGESRVQRDTWQVNTSGTMTESEIEKLEDSGCAVGRRPEGLCPVERRFTKGTLAAHFAQIAHLEAASVYAFERLARELTRFGAPASLIARAAGSALDEIRHAQLMGATARRFGAEPYLVRLSNLPARGLYQLALENAVEGCVHETFGALIAHHQAARAQDPELRSAMRGIAYDETRHAELAWHVAAWVTPQLSAAQRTELAAEQMRALRALLQAQHQPTLPPSAARAIGLPEPSVACALVRQLRYTAERMIAEG